MMMLHEAASEKATRAAATAEGETQREREKGRERQGQDERKIIKTMQHIFGSCHKVAKTNASRVIDFVAAT